MKPKLVYVAGPYRAEHGYQVELNIQNAWRWGLEVARLGAYPVIPHTNSSHMCGANSDTFWLESTLEVMRRCDAVLFLPEWQRSAGARGEHAEAKRLKMPCFFSIQSLEEWLKKPVAKRSKTAKVPKKRVRR